MAMQANENVVRVNVRVSKKIKKYFEDKSKETGVPQAHLMALALEEYIDQKEVIKFTSANSVQDLIEILKKEVNNE